MDEDGLPVPVAILDIWSYDFREQFGLYNPPVDVDRYPVPVAILDIRSGD